jgi:glycosyltransferase involved in cell wall biosynthesis
MSDILSIATAAVKPEQRNGNGQRKLPRVDYIELQRKNDVDVLDYDAYRHSPLGDYLGRLETKVRSDIYLAVLGYLRQRDYRMVFAWSERAGIPMAGLRRMSKKRNPFAAMFTCWSERQEKAITRLNLWQSMDTIAVHCESMKRHFVKLGAPAEKVNVIKYSVDHRFFSPMPEVDQEPGLVLSLGEIRSRDYMSLFKAVEGLPLRLLVAASGAWYARQKNTQLTRSVPDNVTVSGGFPLPKLKELYARSQFLVLPLYDQIYSAGATATLEAMGMGRAVISFRSRGIVDYIQHGETGLLVEPGDTAGMRDAIRGLLDNPEKARQMGENGRAWVESELNLDRYVNQVSDWLKSSLT